MAEGINTSEARWTNSAYTTRVYTHSTHTPTHLSLSIFTLGALLSGLYRERRCINLEIRLEIRYTHLHTYTYIHTHTHTQLQATDQDRADERRNLCLYSFTFNGL